MTAPDRDHLLALIESLRADMISKLDTLAAAVQGTGPAAPAATSPHQRRVLYRGAIVPTDIDRAKARVALARMGIKP